MLEAQDQVVEEQVAVEDDEVIYWISPLFCIYSYVPPVYVIHLWHVVVHTKHPMMKE